MTNPEEPEVGKYFYESVGTDSDQTILEDNPNEPNESKCSGEPLDTVCGKPCLVEETGKPKVEECSMMDLQEAVFNLGQVPGIGQQYESNT